MVAEAEAVIDRLVFQKVDVDSTTVLADARAVWRDEITPILHDYIAIPALSPALDADWHANGHIARAVELVADWCLARPIAGLTVDVAELSDHTPLIVIEILALGGGPTDDTVLLYGHLDKQPEMYGWRTGLGRTPVVEGDRLYGRRPTTATRGSPRWPPSRPFSGGWGPRPMPRARRSQRGERLAPPAGPPGGPRRAGSAHRRSSSASTRAATTTSGSG